MVINEILTSPKKPALSGSAYPWLELYNGTSSSVDLGFWTLSDGGNFNAPFPAGQNIPAGGYLVIDGSQAGLNFGAHLTLFDRSGNVLDSVQAPSLGDDQSYARVPDGSSTWFTTAKPTYGSANVYASLDQATATATVLDGIQMTVYAIQTEVALPLPSEPVTPVDPSLDATEAESGRRPRATRVVETYPAMSIADVRKLPDESAATTSGVVTMPTGGWDVTRAYIQDDGAGLLVHTFGSVALHVGDTLTIKGRVHHYRGEAEFAAIKNGEQVAPGGTEPGPLSVAPGDVGGGLEALLVQTTGHVTSIQRDYAVVADDAGSARVYLYTRLSLPNRAITSGDPLTIIGVVNASDTGGGYRLVPRTVEDLVVGALPPAEATNPDEPSAPARPARAVTPAGSASRGSSRTSTGTSRSRAPIGGLQTFPAATPTVFVTPASGPRQLVNKAAEIPPAVLSLVDPSSNGLPAWELIAGAAVLVLGGAGASAGVMWLRGGRPKPPGD